MRFPENPNLPEAEVGLAAVSGTYEEVVRGLRRHGVEVVPIGPHPALAEAVRSHADMLCHPLGGSRIVVARGENELKTRLESYGFTVTESASEIERPYPNDAALNAARVGNRLIANPKVLDPIVLKYCREVGIKLLPVRQGYARCSVVIVDENSIVTSDEGVTAAASKAGLDVLKVRPGFVGLPGYPYGFLGGACGKIGKNRLAFAGDLRTHPDCEKIEAFLNARQIEIVCLCGGPLLDVGGILPLMERERSWRTGKEKRKGLTGI